MNTLLSWGAGSVILIRLLLVPALLFAAPAQETPHPGENAGNAADEAVLFEQMPVVEAATLHVQSLKDVPANVSVITRREIRTYGYRTLGEALSSVRGFYPTQDSVMQFIGVRGFSLLGDYNTRVLVMINGHSLTDNIYNSMYLYGQDFGLDMDLVERIEVIRGPSSALYGSNGMLATVNVVTRSPVEEAPARVTLEAGSFGEQKMLFSTSLYLGHGANLLLSGSGFHSSGRTIDSPEMGRTARGVTGAKGYHTFANLAWRNWNVMAAFNQRDALAPFGWYGAAFGDTGTHTTDGHNFVDAAYTREVGSSGRLRWRLYYDQYRYWARYLYDDEDGGLVDNRDAATGDWVGTQLTYTRDLSGVGPLTVGAEFNADLRNVQVVRDLAPYARDYLDFSVRNRYYGLFAQQEWNLTPRWTAFLGARIDGASHLPHFVSPRAALVYRPSPNTAYKLMYGRAFRNPSTYEAFYAFGESYLPNPGLLPEKADTAEVSVERRIHPRVDVTATAYRYFLMELIEADFLPGNVTQYQNRSHVHAGGVELEVAARPGAGIQARASLAVQRTRQDLPNSPGQLAQFQISMPLLDKRLMLAAAGRHVSSRRGADGGLFPAAALADLTATARLHRRFDLQFGVRNLFDRRHWDPLSPEHLAGRQYPLPGRTAFVKLVLQYGE